MGEYEPRWGVVAVKTPALTTSTTEKRKMAVKRVTVYEWRPDSFASRRWEDGKAGEAGVLTATPLGQTFSDRSDGL